jgi:hypothetical protein
MRALLPLLALVLAGLAAPAGAAEQQPITEAETLLFLTDHFKGASPPLTLRYSFSRSGTLEKDKAFNDTVEVIISGNANSRQAATRCLSEAGRRIEVPPIESGAMGNPALQCFLERDIREMERLTGGKANHFRQQIRRTLADNPPVRSTQIDYQGKQVDAKEVMIKPYVSDIFRQRFEKYAGKYYVFTFSDEVPGALFRIEAVIPDGSGESGAPAKDPLVDEVMAFTGTSAGGGKANK